MKTPIIDSIKAYIKEANLRLHMPAHKGMALAEDQDLFGDSLYEMDLTEVFGTDDLHNPKGAIAEAEKLTAHTFGAGQSFFLINGATAGIHAAFLVGGGPGKRVLIPRHCHRSVLSALILTGSHPVYLPTEVCPSYQMPLGVDQSSLAGIASDNAFDLVFNVRPTYEGIVEPIHTQVNGMQVVDEAHGGHFRFSPFLPASALESGGDTVIQGAHKTLGSLTQTGLLHLKKDDMRAGFRQALSLVQSTSPSYLLLASLDLMRYNLEKRGQQQLETCVELAGCLRQQIAKTKWFYCLNEQDVTPRQLDLTKLVFGTNKLSGFQLADFLRRDYKIQVEMAAARYVVAMLTLNDYAWQGLELVQAVSDLSKRLESYDEYCMVNSLSIAIPRLAILPREAFFTKKLAVRLEEAQGLIAAETFCPYPPGIPLVCPGEVITGEVIDCIKIVRENGIHWQGCNDPELKCLQVVDE